VDLQDAAIRPLANLGRELIDVAGYHTRLTAPALRTFTGKHGYPAQADLLINDVQSADSGEANTSRLGCPAPRGGAVSQPDAVRRAVGWMPGGGGDAAAGRVLFAGAAVLSVLFPLRQAGGSR
jgi:hypothetical protein